MNRLKNCGLAAALLLLSGLTLQAQDSTALNQSEKTIKKYKPLMRIYSFGVCTSGEVLKCRMRRSRM
jgi:hypothetical protein